MFTPARKPILHFPNRLPFLWVKWRGGRIIIPDQVSEVPHIGQMVETWNTYCCNMLNYMNLGDNRDLFRSAITFLFRHSDAMLSSSCDIIIYNEIDFMNLATWHAHTSAALNTSSGWQTRLLWNPYVLNEEYQLLPSRRRFRMPSCRRNKYTHSFLPHSVSTNREE